MSITYPHAHDLASMRPPASQRRPLSPDDLIRAIAQPPTLCPDCWYETNQAPFPADASTRQCDRHKAATLARRHVRLADLNARLRLAVEASAIPAQLPSHTFCPHCYRKQSRALPALAFVQNCRQHSDYDPVCGVCRGHYDAAAPCACCGGLGYIFPTIGEQAAFCLEIPFTRHTAGAGWLVNLLRRVAASDAWAADDWEDAYIRMEPLTRPGMLWHRQPFAHAAMRLVVAEAGDLLLSRLPTVCAACLCESRTLSTPASYRLQPCARHLAGAQA